MALPDGANELDLTRAAHNLYAFAKTWGTLGDEPVIGVFHGTMFASIEGRRLQALFGYAGTGITMCRFDQDGSLHMRGKETGWFTDLATGEVLDQWDNPFTGETVDVFHFTNDRIGGRLTEEMPMLVVGEHHEEGAVMNDLSGDHDGRSGPGARPAPFVLPWQVYGDEVLLEWDYAHQYPNPVDPARFPRASTGATINPSEHFVIYTSLSELADLDRPSAHFRAGFSRLSPWWPWMRMGGVTFDAGVGSSSGTLFGRMFSRSARRGLDDVPVAVRRRIERDCPDMLEAPDDWELGPILSTWEAYAAATPPE